MNRSLDEITTNINTIIELNTQYPDSLFYNIAVLQQQDGRTFPMTKIAEREGKKISPNDTKGITFYHRIASQSVNAEGGKGSKVYQTLTYNMILVGVGHRPRVTTETPWNNEDIARDIMGILGSNPFLENKELILTQGQVVTDKLSVLQTEYAGQEEMRYRDIDLIAFQISYLLKIKQLSIACSPYALDAGLKTVLTT